MQKLICENNLIILALQAGLNDPEFYAQITALKCLAAATKIESIWREVLDSNRHTYVSNILYLKNFMSGFISLCIVNKDFRFCFTFYDFKVQISTNVTNMT